MNTSNRRQAFAQPQSNPATKFIDWKSNDKCFSYYDKEIAESMKGSTKDEIKEKATVKIQLPFKFLTLDELHTVKGWSDSCQSAIFSNEVKFISKEIMTVKPFKGNEIAKGLYSDIKEKIKAAGAHYVKSIYIMLEDGSLAKLQLKGASCQAWGDFTQKNRSRLPEEWVTVGKAIEGKKGSVKYSTPEFKFEKSLSEDESVMADDTFRILETYLKSYLVKSEPVIDAPVEDPIDEDDIEF